MVQIYETVDSDKWRKNKSYFDRIIAIINQEQCS